MQGFYDRPDRLVTIYRRDKLQRTMQENVGSKTQEVCKMEYTDNRQLEGQTTGEWGIGVQGEMRQEMLSDCRAGLCGVSAGFHG